MTGAPEIAALGRRADFPVLEELTYLNTASIGLVPLPVQFAAQQIEREIAVRGTTWFDEEVETGVLERARVAAGRLLNARPDSIAIVSSATEALGQIAWALRPGKGTNVVTASIEFPSVSFPWLRVAAETGAEVRFAGSVESPGELSLASIEALVDGRTEVIAVSHIQYSNGALLPLEALSDLARTHDARLVVDATQAAGHAPINLGAEGVEVTALVAGGYKWLCGPFGAGFCYVGDHLLERLEPVLVGWRSTPEPYRLDAGRLALAKDARKLEFSTMSYSAAVGLGAAIEYVLDLGVDEVLDHDRRLTRRLEVGLRCLGFELVTPPTESLRGGTLTVRREGRDGSALAARLNAAGIIVSPRAGMTRFSAHFFNDSSDIDHALAVLQNV